MASYRRLLVSQATARPVWKWDPQNLQERHVFTYTLTDRQKSALCLNSGNINESIQPRHWQMTCHWLILCVSVCVRVLQCCPTVPTSPTDATTACPPSASSPLRATRTCQRQRSSLRSTRCLIRPDRGPKSSSSSVKDNAPHTHTQRAETYCVWAHESGEHSVPCSAGGIWGVDFTWLPCRVGDRTKKIRNHFVMQIYSQTKQPNKWGGEVQICLTANLKISVPDRNFGSREGFLYACISLVPHLSAAIGTGVLV